MLLKATAVLLQLHCSKQQIKAHGLIDVVSPAGRGHAPHTQTAQLLMAQPYFGTIAGTDTAEPAGNRKEL